MFRPAAITWFVLFSVVSTASAAQRFTLRYKFQVGDVIRYDVSHQANIRSTMEGASQTAETRSDSVKAWKIVDVTPRGEIELINLVEKVKMTNRLPDRAEMAYDSTVDKTPPLGFEHAAKAVGTPLSQIRMTPWGEVLKREVKHRQPAADDTAPIVLLLPKKPIAVGGTWDEPQQITVKLSEGGTKSVDARRHFKLKSVENGVATIECDFQVLSPMTAEIEGQLAQRMLTGAARFDIRRGRILSQELKADKRVIGFAGPQSSMHLVLDLSEKMQAPAPGVARRP
jgi:hypothetical protein